MRKVKFLFGVLGLLLSANAQAVLIDISFSDNFPFGPFLPNEDIEIEISLTNNSADQAVTICEGICIGDIFTYSLGGLASIPSGYSFSFGNTPDISIFDGQVAGILLPGETIDFIFGIYTPDVAASPGWYGFSTQLQVFDATVNRSMLTSSTFSGNWEIVSSVPAPATLLLFLTGLIGLIGFNKRRNAA